MGYFGRTHASKCRGTAVDELIATGERIAETLPRTAHCARCERGIVLAAGRLPADWVEIDCEAVCPDCAPRALREATESAQVRHDGADKKARRSIDTPRHVAIGNEGTRYGGCRVTTEPVRGGFVNIGIRGGWKAPDQGHDPAAQFMINGKGLDELIDHLCSIRRDLPHG